MTKLPPFFWAVLLPSAGLLAFHSAYFLPFLSDDSLISFRYAQRLLDGHGLTWTDGPRVEGYSNLLWVLLVAGLGQVGLDLIVSARALGFAGMTCVMAALVFWCGRGRTWRVAWWPVAVSLLFVALAGPIAVWAIGGLEEPLFAALIAVSIPLTFLVIEREDSDPARVHRRTLCLSLVLGLVCLTRPDGPIFAAASAISILIVGWARKYPRPVTSAALVLLVPVAFVIGQLIFRWMYYGELVPNTARVKIAASSTHWTFGVQYLTDGFRALSPFSTAGLACLLGLLAIPRHRSRGLFLCLATAMWSVYVAFIGGDVFPAYRHLVPLVVIAAFALAEGAIFLMERVAVGTRWFLPLAIASLLAFVPYVRSQAADKWIGRALTERWEWQGKEVALLLKQVFTRQQPLTAVTAAGSVPYWSELPSLDMMGLNDYHVARNRPADFGRGMVGHELGDGRYVLSRRPDLIVFDVGSPEPGWRTGKELNALPEFHDRYVPVHVRTAPIEYAATIFVDKYSERIGVSQSDAQLVVPGFLVTGPDAVAVARDSELVLRLTGPRPATLTFKADANRRWVVAEAQDTKDTGTAMTLPNGVQVDLQQDGQTIVLTARSTRTGPVDVQRFVLTAAPRPLAGVPAAAVFARPRARPSP